MNQSFFHLPEERRQAILNAGFQVFSQYPYRKAPVGEIAAEAGISKSLLFYYFRNKKELYLFLWNQAVELTRQFLAEQDVMGTTDYFEMLQRSLRGKCTLMREYPHATEFSLRAYYESDPEVAGEIRDCFSTLEQQSFQKALEKMDLSRFREGIDPNLAYQEMVWAADGYLHQILRAGALNPERVEADFERLISLWRTVYLR